MIPPLRILLALMLGLLIVEPSRGQGLATVDRVRLIESFALAEAIQNDVWPEWSEAPFDVLLIAGDHEYYIGEAPEETGFQPAETDRIAGRPVSVRAAQHAADLLATFPAFSARPVVVIGTAEATGMTSTEWVVTLLHEHFHQLQMSQPDYFAAVDSLDLANGDETGMWMLNYPFPYEDPEVGRRFDLLSRQLGIALSGEGEMPASEVWRQFEALFGVLSEADKRYISFVLWQEGVARYVELQVAERVPLGVRPYRPTGAFRALGDFEPYAGVATRIRHNIMTDLQNQFLAEERRAALYPLGAGLAMLLDREIGNWRERYFDPMFRLDRYRDPALGARPACDNDFDGGLLLAVAAAAPLVALEATSEGSEGLGYVFGALAGVAGFWVGLAVDSTNCSDPDARKER